MFFIVLHIFRPVPVHVSLLLVFDLAPPATLYLADRMLAVERRGLAVVP
jgi:hypothetical protein